MDTMNEKRQTVETINDHDVVFHNVLEEPFELFGFCQSDDLVFRRVPSQIAERTSAGVANLAQESTGGRLRFSTDSPYIALRVRFRRLFRTPNMTLISNASFDLYLDGEFGAQHVRSFPIPCDSEDSFEALVKLNGGYMQSYTLYFPVHSVVENVEIGFAPDAIFGESDKPYRDLRPLVFYGSSIVHGIAASRSGNTYPAMISRRLNMDFRNIGFSGAARAEEAICDWITTLPMSVFVYDYDHNAPTVEYLEETHYKFYTRFREARPEIPVIMITRPDYGYLDSAQSDTLRRRDIILRSYLSAREAGDENVYFIDGLSFHIYPHRDEMTVDSCHPNDAGFIRMADAIGTVIQIILEKSTRK